LVLRFSQILGRPSAVAVVLRRRARREMLDKKRMVGWIYK
jgi:hypothetical protein